MHKFLELICVKSNLVVEHMVMCWPCSSLTHRKVYQVFVRFIKDSSIIIIYILITYNLSSMSTKIEIVVVLVTDVAVNYCSCG